MQEGVLSRFHPLVAKWFTAQVGRPTDVQAQAWPTIAAGEHVLITAPTGSGKTLTAFLWAINQMLTETRPTGITSLLYVSPLKALNNDIQRNLLRPLNELKQVFRAANEPFPQIRVLTRSGDTPQSERRRMLRQPPEFLITTPESLNLLLSSVGGRSTLTHISTVILDEIHGVVGTKRGTHLMTAVERLVRLSGEFQRIALSATIRPIDVVADFVGGYMLQGSATEPRYIPRRVSVVCSQAQKAYDIQVRFPEEAADTTQPASVWEPMVEEFKQRIGQNQSTLLFTNSRRLCERLTLMINATEDEPIAYAHHGSLSRELRETVEAKLKGGELKAIVATSSLEMGIDIGALDEVALIQSPPSISSAIQRIGRAGHQVGAISRGTLFPTHARDFIDAAVLAKAILDRDLEAVKPVTCPLDVLAQVIISMVAMETWDIDELYTHLKTSYPYRNLRREVFEQVLNMLDGRYADSRIRELQPRVSIDRMDNTVESRKGAIQALYASGGTIPDRGYFHLRHHETNARIGELDEEFVWENGEGSTFTLGAQHWKVERVTHNDVFVSPGNPKVKGPPFWKGEESGRDFHFSERIGQFLEMANERLEDAGFLEYLQENHDMNAAAAERLVSFLERQKVATGCDLPHRHHLLIEFVNAGPDKSPGNQVVLHTLWGGRVNQPFGMALAAAWEERYGHKPEVYAVNDCVVLLLPHEISSLELLSLVTPATIQSLLRKQLEGSGFFGARFRECAGRSLLLTANRPNQRTPLWLNRLRSKRLLEAVMGYDDFPILLEAWRTCLQDEFDLDSLQRVLSELQSGDLRWTEAHTQQASPFAQSIAWWQVNQYMYMGDEPNFGLVSKLRSDLLRDVVFTPGLRPTVPTALVAQYEEKRQRLFPGYAPQTPRELVDWVKERWLIPASEWEALLAAIRRDTDSDTDELVEAVAERVGRVIPAGASEPLVVSLERLPQVIGALYLSPEAVELTSIGASNAPIVSPEITPDVDDEAINTVIGEWLQFYGPRTVAFVQSTLGIDPGRLALVLEDLIDAQKLVHGDLVAGSDVEQVCDSENFEMLLRLMCSEATPTFAPLDMEWLSLFLAHHQGLTAPKSDVEGLFRCVEQLACYAAPAALWESEVFPARLQDYMPAWLDTLMLEGNLQWVGGEGHQVAFCFGSDRELMGEEPDSFANPEDSDDPITADASAAEPLLPDPYGRYDFSTLLRTTALSAPKLADSLWEAVWRGEMTNDTFMALRRGVQNRFRIPEMAATSGTNAGARRPGRRIDFSRWRNTMPYAGNWYQLPATEAATDLLEVEERNKDRVRLLLDRYGLLFRELLQRELPALRWSSVFRALRLMELSGEVLAGYFFQGIPGPQFISHQAFRLLQRGLPEDVVYFLNATDPASLCGLPLDALRGKLPRRIASTHLVYRGRTLVMVSERNGKTLTLHVPPDDADLQACFGVLQHLLTREFQPMRSVAIETINEQHAARSEYLDPLRTAFEVALDFRHVILYRKRDPS